jgi:hypothetical protein
MATEQNNMTGQNGAVGDYGNGSSMRTSMRGISMQNGMGGMNGDADKRKTKKEYRAKMRRYKAKHDQAKSVFERITGKAPKTRMEAEELYAEILKRGSAMEKAKAAFAVADFCWACDEKEAEKEIREELDDFDGADDD